MGEMKATVIGGGLAGCECALQLAMRKVQVTLIEQRGTPKSEAPAHRSSALAELVCSNSLKSTDPNSAAGLLKQELAAMNCRLLAIAEKSAVPAGKALAVDRNAFSAAVEAAIADEPRIRVVRHVATQLPDGPAVIAAGPLCGGALAEALGQVIGRERLSFYDAAAPIVDATSIDRSIVFSQSRWEEGLGDYLNCPMDKDEYDSFITELVSAQRVTIRDFERGELFSACQPVEEVARSSHDALRYGALKPVGLTDPRTGQRPWAVVQLRPENRDATAFNLVGFQTNLTWTEQGRVFRMIPGLSQAEFLRYGVMHRNSFVDAPRVLDHTFKIPGTTLRLAGQITGTEGYVEAIATGLLAALNTYADLVDAAPVILPSSCALGSLVAYATDPATHPYQPMHVNFGLVPPLEKRIRGKRDRYAAYASRARQDLSAYLSRRTDVFTPQAIG